MSEKSVTIKNVVKISLILLVIFGVGGIGGVYFDQQVLPFIRTNKHLSRINFLKHSAENVTVINKTEQVTIKEDDSINEVASQASNAVVNIISLGSQKDLATRMTKNTDQSGTGIIVTSDGLIATYRSAIIEKNATYKVLLFNGANYDAKLLGIDEFSDLAFLKIEATNLTAISFGDSSRVYPGKKLVAIGNSFGEYQNRYASGLLSNLAKTYNLAGKTVSSSEKLEGVFESDFNNQKEYVGGPVIGYSGDLIGINGAIVVDGQNQYFQIPSNIVQKAVGLALSNELENRPFLGAYYVSITKEYAIAHSLNRDRGALIFSPSGKQGLAVIAFSPAEKAGLKINDIVLAVNDQNINLDNPLSNLISQYKKGDEIKLLIDREGSEVKISVKL
ncbi:MAG: 2-alkenal reductase [Parcubacteria group bacterium GW2011_GWD2_38_11]|nr:MAG: 2-alkenal reductase [Parcubacteria group bacterium GW2011_GWD2_38_11]